MAEPQDEKSIGSWITACSVVKNTYFIPYLIQRKFNYVKVFVTQSTTLGQQLMVV